MLSRRHSAIAFLWLAATSLGKITVTLPDHITVEQQTVIRWTRGAQDPVSNYDVRTVPSIDLEVRALHPDNKSRLSGTITVVFHESPTGLVVLKVLNKENPNIVYTTSSPFNVFNTDGTTGSEGSSATLSRTATSTEAATGTGLPTSSGSTSSGSSPAGVIAGAVFGSLAVLGLLGGILLWLRRRNWQSKALSSDPFSSTVELRSIPNEKLLPSSRHTSLNLARQDLSFPSTTKPRLSLSVAVQGSQILVQNTTQTRHNEVQNLGPEERNISIEEMAAGMQRMESDIVRLNQHLLPPAYSSLPSTQ